MLLQRQTILTDTMTILENYRQQKWNEVQQVAARVLMASSEDDDQDSDDATLISVDTDEEEDGFEETEFVTTQTENYHADHEIQILQSSDIGLARQTD